MKTVIVRLKFFLHNINLSRVVCTHLFSKQHTETHRMCVGVVFIAVGVAISKIETTIHAVHFLLDGIGYGIHGIGVTPFIDKLASAVKDNGTEPTKETPQEVVSAQSIAECKEI